MPPVRRLSEASEQLLAKLRERIADGRVLELIQRFLQAGVLEELRDWKPTESGTPQGGVISPLLSNVYLNELDHAVAARGGQMVRYADDFVVLCRDGSEAEAMVSFLREWTSAAGLTLHPTKTRVVDWGQGQSFEFLGWHFERGHKWPREKSQEKLREVIRQKTRRTSGQSLEDTVENLNRTLRGWFGYFGASVKSRLREQDQFMRRRLRAILCKRQKRPGSGRAQLAHRQWPNAWFAQQGCSVWNTAPVSTASLTVRPHRLESRMREIRPSGSEGGVRFYPGEAEVTGLRRRGGRGEPGRSRQGC